MMQKYNNSSFKIVSFANVYHIDYRMLPRIENYPYLDFYNATFLYKNQRHNHIENILSLSYLVSHKLELGYTKLFSPEYTFSTRG